MLFLLFLITSGIALAIGFVLGRIWEIRQTIERQTASDAAPVLNGAPSDCHAVLADRLARPRGLLASHGESQMSF